MDEQAVSWWVRAVLWLAAAQALLLLAALVQPSAVSLLVPWPASPLNARFIASLYVALGSGVVLSGLASTFREMRIVFAGVAIATTLLLVLTVVRMVVHPHELTTFPLFWLAFYIVDPVLVGVVFARMGWGRTAAGGGGLPRALWLAEAALFGVAGVVLMALPGVAQALWPWIITEPQAQLYSAFFITLAVCSLLAVRERDWTAVRWLVLMIALLALLVLGVSLIHLSRFTRTASTVVWMAVLVAEAAVFGALFVLRGVRGRSLAVAR